MIQKSGYGLTRASKGFAILRLERRPVQRWATQLCFRKTTPFWTKEMATPQTDTHVREQTRRDEQGHKNGDAARAGVEKLADFRQRATGEDGERLARQSG